MFPFLIKKAFFDMWDNLFRIFALNLGYVLIISGTGFLLSAVPQAQLAYFAVLVIGSAALSVFTMGTAAITSELADYKTPEWRVFVDAIRARWLPALLVVVINAAIFLFLLVIALPVYTQSTIGLIALGLLGWAAVFWLLSLQAFFPLITRMADPFGKTIRKCLTLLFDNTGFTAGLFIALNVSAPYLLGLFLLLFLGAPTRLLAFGSPMLLLPGPASAVLLLTVAFKLRMYKYDFLEEQQQASADQAATDQADPPPTRPGRRRPGGCRAGGGQAAPPGARAMGRAAGRGSRAGGRAHAARDDLSLEGIDSSRPFSRRAGARRSPGLPPGTSTRRSSSGTYPHAPWPASALSGHGWNPETTWPRTHSTAFPGSSRRKPGTAPRGPESCR